jgi:hypothetical protein
MPKTTIVCQPSLATVVSDTVGPLDPLDAVGQARNISDFFDSGYNVAPTAALPAGGVAVKIAVGPDKNIHFLNPAILLF